MHASCFSMIYENNVIQRKIALSTYYLIDAMTKGRGLHLTMLEEHIKVDCWNIVIAPQTPTKSMLVLRICWLATNLKFETQYRPYQISR